MKPPLVSILIPVYNRVDLISRALGSAVEQTYDHVEIIVTDNHSSDGTWDVVCDWASRDVRIRPLRNDRNVGPLRNWQNGWMACKGEYVKILWSDDWMEPNCVEECVRRVVTYDSKMVFSSVVIHRPGEKEHAYWFRGCCWLSREQFFYKAVVEASTPVSPGCALLPRSDTGFRTDYGDHRRLQRIAEETGAGPDMLLLWEAALRSARIAYIEEPLNHFHAGPTSITMSQTSTVMNGYRLAYRYFVQHMLSDVELKAQWRTWRAHRFYRQTAWRAVFRSLRMSWRAARRWLAVGVRRNGR